MTKYLATRTNKIVEGETPAEVLAQLSYDDLAGDAGGLLIPKKRDEIFARYLAEGALVVIEELPAEVSALKDYDEVSGPKASAALQASWADYRTANAEAIAKGQWEYEHRKELAEAREHAARSKAAKKGWETRRRRAAPVIKREPIQNPFKR